MPEFPAPVPAHKEGHLYGGQALPEGVMMRGREIWAAAIRRPDGSIYVESHEIDSVVRRHPILAKPGLRGVIALGQALSLGFEALTLALTKSQPDEDGLSTGGLWLPMTLAIVLFIGFFFLFPAFVFRLAQDHLGVPSGLSKALEGIFRVGLLIGYVSVIGLLKDVRRVYQYHGAEHKTIAAYEYDAPLTPDEVDKFSTLHVRCGTNFLLIIFIIAFVVFLFVGTPNWLWFLGSRILAFPVIAALAYEALRLGARFKDSKAMHALMVPGLWLQKITTRPPDHDQIEVAIASFEEVLRAERDESVQVEGEFTAITLDPEAPGVGIRPSAKAVPRSTDGVTPEGH